MNALAPPRRSLLSVGAIACAVLALVISLVAFDASSASKEQRPPSTAREISVSRVPFKDIRALRQNNDLANDARQKFIEQANSWRASVQREENDKLRAAKSVPSDVTASADQYRRTLKRRDAYADTVLAKVSVRMPEREVQVVAEPLLLTVELLEQELQRSLGPSLRTEIKSLQRLSRSDILADHLILRYGRAVTYPVGDPQAPRGVEELSALARELALLSTRQVSALDRAWKNADQRLSQRFASRSLAAVGPKHAWLMAPVRMLLLDACKHWGKRCESYHWFESNEAALVAQTRSNGWASGRVYLYNRATGALDGFFLATNEFQLNRFGRGPHRYVDPMALLASMADPRALGMGQCALAGMVSQPPVWVAALGMSVTAPTAVPKSTKLYVCPAFGCGAQSLAAVGGTPQFGSPLPPGASNELRTTLTKAFLLWRWPELTADIVAQMQSGMCGLGTAQDQGPLPSIDGTDDCLIETLFNKSDPHDNYLGCVAEAVGAGTDTLLDVQAYDGVPAPPECGLARGLTSGGGGGDSGASGGDDDIPLDDIINEFIEGDITREEFQAALKEWAGTDSGGGADTGGDGGTPPDSGPASTPLPPAARPPDVVSDAAGDPECQTRSCLEGVRTIIENMLGAIRSGESKEDEGSWKAGHDYIDGIIKNMKARERQGGQSCLDPLQCEASCTGIGRQVAQLNQCTDKYVDELLAAAGMPARGVNTNTPWRDPRKEHPSPDAPGEESDAGACLPSNNAAAPNGSWSANGVCGLALCPDVADTVNGCCGVSSTTVTRALVDPICLKAMCSGEDPNAEACSCTALGSEANYTMTPPGSLTMPQETPGDFEP